VAKRLKEENDSLHAENAQLKEKISTYERELLAQKADENKRWRDKPSADFDDRDPPSKRSRLSVKTPSAFQVPTPTTITLTPSPPALVSSPGSNVSSENVLSPLPAQSSAQEDIAFPTTVTTLDSIFNFPPGPKAPVLGSAHSLEAFECAFCMGGTSCVCREIALRPPEAPFKAEAAAPPDSAQLALPSPPQIVAPSILDNLPPYQAPVPLRRNPAMRPLRSLFPVIPLPNSSQAMSRTTADCSGDPSNCLACADDVFGQAFCAAVCESLASGRPFADCPRGAQYLDGAPSDASQEGGNSAETIPTSDAWRQLKSHPNVSFADLTLLAEVVARRSKCTGPTVVISPPPGSFTPERRRSPVASKESPAVGVDDSTVLLSDPHAHYHRKEKERSVGSPSMLAPEQHLRSSPPQLVRQVHAAGVREALALLDSRF
jgi:AP-1-like transcription factor